VTDDLSGLTLTEQGKVDPLRQQALVFATVVPALPLLCYTGRPEYALLTTTRGNHVLQYTRKMLHATDKMSLVANGAMCLHLACHVAMKSLELMARVPPSIPAQLTVVLKFNMMY
jgi:hypothetical protein